MGHKIDKRFLILVVCGACFVFFVILNMHMKRVMRRILETDSGVIPINVLVSEKKNSSKLFDASKEIDPITGPVGLTNRGALSVRNNVLIVASGEYSDITFRSNSTLTIDGDVTLYITGALDTASNTEIIITEDSDVEIYGDGLIDVSSNSTISNETLDPTKLKIFGTDSLVNDGTDPGVRFHSNTDVYTVVQSSNSDVSLKSNAEVFGAIIADNIIVHSNSYVHYDVALRDVGSSSDSYSVSTWQER